MVSDKRISELVELTSLAADDELPVVDSSANATKRVTYDTLATEVRTESEPLTGTTATFSGALSADTGTFSGNVTAQANLDVEGDLAFDSGFGSTATAYGVRAWVHFDGNDGSILGSGNVDSITKNGTGDYTVSIENDMPDSNYLAIASDAGGCSRITYRRAIKNNGSYRFELLCVGTKYDTTVSLTIVR